MQYIITSLVKRVLLVSLFIVTPALFAESLLGIGSGHIVSLRFGGSLDQNIGLTSSDIALKRLNGSFGLGLSYEFLPIPFISIGPEFYYHAHRTAIGYLDNEQSFKVNWHEMYAGVMFRTTIMGLLYSGYGLGMGYATQGKSEQGDIGSLSSSIFPYFALELGGNIPLFSPDDGSTLITVNVALRGTSNIKLWKDSIEQQHLQNDFSIGLFVGFSALWVQFPV
ncbi:hypothetical protein [Entomospira culicis]|uniref:Uncharacterized protein n=1 Tax=Entomospira culicis TaxID=2719989 RepID=A0A968KWC4_9SPIO|nr:hypothetical protein [Entomospira culicis]NIZ19940.1 hypothetical protein [Entomospira culicis]NIZ70103.1 hypothetical protein [Entomospira culicis]WDI38030.1 hypothetical protein PVA46_07780 [Entomospira culicis]WDI39653.1 hypothetical protein PVA47_07780 [Entomospira culicis]